MSGFGQTSHQSKTKARHIPKQLETRPVTTEDAGRDWARMDAHSHREVAGLGPKCHLQLLRQLPHFEHAITSESGHYNGMLTAGSWQSSGGDVA